MINNGILLLDKYTVEIVPVGYFTPKVGTGEGTGYNKPVVLLGDHDEAIFIYRTFMFGAGQ
jgi:hypothetical protein